jgi:hypothetical protein
MSESFQPLSCEQTLGRIQECLSQGASAAVIIEEMMPQTRDEALRWARRLSGWDEYQRQYPAQIVSLARLISRRTMREFSLTLRADGRVVEKPRDVKPWKTPPAVTFQLELADEPVQVQYTRGYFPDGFTDMLYFTSPHEPGRPHPLSDTGYLGHLVPSDVVKACGGPQAYAILLADAILRGEEEEFRETFEGAFPKTGQHQRRQAKRPQPTPGGHAAKVIAEEDAPRQPSRQGMLF